LMIQVAPRLADCLLNPVVVSPSRVGSFHLARIGRCVRKGGADRKCPVPSDHCSRNTSSPGCPETQRCCVPGRRDLTRRCPSCSSGHTGASPRAENRSS
jgi:hypothetical protein